MTDSKADQVSSASGHLALGTLMEEVRALGPWHMNIELTSEASTGLAYSPQGTKGRTTTGEVALQDFRSRFLRQLDAVFPHGLTGKRFLDCACNAGGYSFWARERDAEFAFGFDAREHWIRQAEFVKRHRTLAATDRIEFRTCDLADLPKLQLDPFDLTMFKGIFYHLPDPISGLRIAADLTREVLWLNTATVRGFPDGMLKVAVESRELLMSGVDGLTWFPTGPAVLVEILKWLGFAEIKQTLQTNDPLCSHLGRVELVAARTRGMLAGLPGTLVFPALTP